MQPVFFHPHRDIAHRTAGHDEYLPEIGITYNLFLRHHNAGEDIKKEERITAHAVILSSILS